MSEGINNQYDFFKKVNLDDDGNIGVSLIGGDGQSLTNEQNETLAHFVYNPVTDQLEADRAITTTLNSFYLGEQHKMSSGGENMFFTNLTSGINFFPMWGGVKDHSDSANRTVDGVIAPSGRVYSDFFSLVLGDVTDVGVYLPYEGENTFGANISGLGITTTLGEDLPNTIRLEYRLYIGGKLVYSQPLENESGYLKDDSLEWWFDHPVEIRQGTTIVAKITKVIKATDIDDGTLLVYSGVDTITGLTRYQTTVHNRVFADKNILLEGDIDTDGLQAEIDLNTSERHEHVNKTVLDNFGEDESQKLTYNGEVVGSGSEESIPVTALESHYIPYAADFDWGNSQGTNTGVIFTLPAVLSDGRYFVDYGLNISPISSDAITFAMTHIRINDNKAPWTTRYMKDASADVSSADFKYMNGGSYLNLEVGDVVTLYMESADNVTMNGGSNTNTHVSFIRMNQLQTHTVVADASSVPVTALFEQRKVLGANVGMPVTTAGFITFVEQIGAVTVPNDGKYLCRAVLPFAGVSDDSWVIRVGVAIMHVGDSVYTQHSEERLQTSVPNFNGVANYDRAIDLQAGDKVVVTVVCNAADSWNIASTNDGCYLDIRQLPTHTVVPTISEEAIPVDDQAASGYVDIGAMRMQWGIMNSTVFSSQGAANDGSRITYPVAFRNTPTLTGSLTDGSNQATNLTFSGVTTTKGVVRLRDLDVNSWETNSFEVSWVAIGLK